jgi:hypothetical protein
MKPSNATMMTMTTTTETMDVLLLMKSMYWASSLLCGRWRGG